MTSRRIIALSGRRGSGKSTAANVIAEVASRKGLDTVFVSFADPLKDGLYAMFRDVDTKGRLEEALWDSSEYREQEISFGVTSFTARRALTTLGTEWGRKFLGENVWVDHAMQRARKFAQDAVVVITDARFENELRTVREEGGQVWLIDRPERDTWFRWFTRHRSERSFFWPHAAARHASATIPNDRGLSDFKKIVENLATASL